MWEGGTNDWKDVESLLKCLQQSWITYRVLNICIIQYLYYIYTRDYMYMYMYLYMYMYVYVYVYEYVYVYAHTCIGLRHLLHTIKLRTQSWVRHSCAWCLQIAACDCWAPNSTAQGLNTLPSPHRTMPVKNDTGPRPEAYRFPSKEETSSKRQSADSETLPPPLRNSVPVKVLLLLVFLFPFFLRLLLSLASLACFLFLASCFVSLLSSFLLACLLPCFDFASWSCLLLLASSHCFLAFC